LSPPVYTNGITGESLSEYFGNHDVNCTIISNILIDDNLQDIVHSMTLVHYQKNDLEIFLGEFLTHEKHDFLMIFSVCRVTLFIDKLIQIDEEKTFLQRFLAILI
jgi:hypothetical protein